MSAVLNQAPSIARLEQICGLAVLFGVGLIVGFALMLAAVHVVLVVRERHLARRRRNEFRARLRAERSAPTTGWADGLDGIAWEGTGPSILTNEDGRALLKTAPATDSSDGGR